MFKKIFKRKEEILGNHVKYSYSTAIHSSSMIAEEYKRKIRNLKVEISSAEDKIIIDSLCVPVSLRVEYKEDYVKKYTTNGSADEVYEFITSKYPYAWNRDVRELHLKHRSLLNIDLAQIEKEKENHTGKLNVLDSILNIHPEVLKDIFSKYEKNKKVLEDLNSRLMDLRSEYEKFRENFCRK